MLIIVNNTLVNTDFILSISPIIGDNCWKNMSNYLCHSGYYFDINLINQKESIRVSLYGHQLFNDRSKWWDVAPDKYLDRCKILEDKVSELRNKLSEFINQCDRSIFPTFNF